MFKGKVICVYKICNYMDCNKDYLFNNRKF